MTLRELDIIVNGVPVYFHKRHDGTIYATECDFSKFIKEEPLHVLRIPVATIPHGWTVDNCPIVADKLKKLRS